MEAARLVELEHLDLTTVPLDDDRTWQEVTAANRERIASLEREQIRTRDTLHELRSETQAVRFLAEKVGLMAEDVRGLAGRVEQVSRRAVEKPTASALALFGQYVGLIVAVVAIVIAASR